MALVGPSYGDVAPMVERLPCKQMAVGSSPTFSTFRHLDGESAWSASVTVARLALNHAVGVQVSGGLHSLSRLWYLVRPCEQGSSVHGTSSFPDLEGAQHGRRCMVNALLV